MQVSPSLLPDHLLKSSAGPSVAPMDTSSFSCSSVDSISASVTRRQEEEEEEVERCKRRPEPNNTSDEEEDETDEEEEESDEDDLGSSGDESTWTWPSCSSRARNSHQSDRKCCNTPSCESSPSPHFESQDRAGSLDVARPKNCNRATFGKNCASGPLAIDMSPSSYPPGASGIFDPTLNKLQ